jgi:hypothetical protein
MLASLLCIPVACAGPAVQSGSFAPPSGAQGTGKQHVHLRIKIPKRGRVKAGHRGHYVSPATTQLSIGVESCPNSCTTVAGYPVTASLTPTSQGCTSTLASTICELSLQLSPGSYKVSLTALDAQGNALSSVDSIAFMVMAGETNVLSVSLSGIPNKIAVAALGADQFLVNAVDIDNDVIAGPGSPTFTVTPTSGIALAVTGPKSTSPNAFSVAAGAAGTAVLGVTASYAGTDSNACLDPGAVCSASFTLTSSNPVAENLFVAMQSGGSGTGTVNEYAAPFTGAPVASNANGVSKPNQIAFDSAFNLYVANQTGPNIAKYVSPYNGSPAATVTHADLPGSPSFLESPIGVAFLSSGSLVVTDSTHQAWYMYEPPVPFIGNQESANFGVMQGIAVDSSQDVFFARGTDVTEFGPFLTSLVVQITNSINNATDAVAYSGSNPSYSGNLFVANTGNNTITEYASPYTGAPISTMTNALNQPAYLAMDPSSGNLYVSNEGNSTITVYAPPYTAAPIQTITSGVAQPTGIALQYSYTLTI